MRIGRVIAWLAKIRDLTMAGGYNVAVKIDDLLELEEILESYRDLLDDGKAKKNDRLYRTIQTKTNDENER